MHFIAILHDVEDDLEGWWHPRKKTSNVEQIQIPVKGDELRMQLILYHLNWKDKVLILYQILQNNKWNIYPLGDFSLAVAKAMFKISVI